MRRVDRRRLRLAKGLAQVLEGAALTAAAAAAGDMRLAQRRAADILEAGARLAETLAAMEDDESGYWRRDRRNRRDDFGFPVRKAG